MAERRWVFGLLLAVAAATGAAGCAESDPKKAHIESQRRSANLAGLAKDVTTSDLESARMAVRALGTLGPQAVPHLEPALQDARIEVREEAALAYGQAAAGDQIHRLASVVRSDPSPEVRAAAATALGNAHAVNEMEAILAALEDPDSTVRARANAAVTRIFGRRYETYVDGTPQQRQEAVAALRRDWQTEERGTRAYYQSTREAKPGR